MSYSKGMVVRQLLRSEQIRVEKRREALRLIAQATFFSSLLLSSLELRDAQSL